MLTLHSNCSAVKTKKTPTFPFYISSLNSWKWWTSVQHSKAVTYWSFSIQKPAHAKFCAGITPLTAEATGLAGTWACAEAELSRGGLAPPFPADYGKWVSVRARAQTLPRRLGGGGGLRLESAWANCTSVCPERRGEWAPSSSRLTEGSLYLFWGGCCDEDCPLPLVLCVRLCSSGVCLLPSAKQLPLGRRRWEGVGDGDGRTGKGGAGGRAGS